MHYQRIRDLREDNDLTQSEIETVESSNKNVAPLPSKSSSNLASTTVPIKGWYFS